MSNKNIRLSFFVKPVFEFLKKIPKGKVVTYGMVAKYCGVSNPRNVGWILQQNVLRKKIPCYKVISVTGHLATGYKFGGQSEQKKRLIADGIKFDACGKIPDNYFLLLEER